MAHELSKTYDPAAIEDGIYSRWLEAGAFRAAPDGRSDRYVVMMPLPNVTGALHLGHAMDNVMQDLLVRWNRMKGANTLWMAGTDHAGIATQAVVEKRLFELEGKTRNDIGREALVDRIWLWKDQYQKRIVSQQQAMGCSCDWDRQRFTMDDVCARAVFHTFHSMFRDGLIYQGNRMVNWDCHLQTAVADDEIEHRAVDGHFWHLRYPVIDPQAGEPSHVIVATTRPETMLGDTAVACHPEPRRVLEEKLAAARESLAKAKEKGRAEAQAEVERLEARIETHLAPLEQLAAMARAGRTLQLPIHDRPIPLITDEWAKPDLGSGCVKITPGHDPNDYEVFGRHRDEIEIVNILNEDGTLNDNAGPFAGQDRFEARKGVVARFEELGLLDQIEDRRIEVGHSDRSKTPIEPFVSRQWFVAMGDIEGGIVLGRGTGKEHVAAGLAQAGIDAVEEGYASPTGRRLTFHPDERYTGTYRAWLAEKRDWCISRQLWWGHRIPIWAAELDGAGRRALVEELAAEPREDLTIRVRISEARTEPITALADLPATDEPLRTLVCVRDPNEQTADIAALEAHGFEHDPDVLDTWFSSGIWPHSTLGWPDPETAAIEEGQSPLGAVDGAADCLDTYYPGNCLVTGRDIITLWVARMVMMGLYNLGDLPFTNCFIHASILDGKGERMSKSKGNGIDPVDIIEKYGSDAMRYVICEMQTGTQDIRLPVQAISPFTGNPIELATAKHGRSIFTYICPESGQEFDVLGTMDDLPSAKLQSDRFDVGRNFCNKLWNAARFAMMNLEGTTFSPLALDDLASEDRWILSRLAGATAEVERQLRDYNPSAAVGAAREFFWTELCDWYLEAIKPRLREGADPASAAAAKQVLATTLDQVLRLLHPMVPFITEELWSALGEIAPARGVDAPLECGGLLAGSPWPEVREEWLHPELEERFGLAQEVIRAVRDLRARANRPPRDELPMRLRASAERSAALLSMRGMIEHLAVRGECEISPEAERTRDSAVAIVGDVEVYIPGLVDLEKERKRLSDQLAGLEKRLGGNRAKLTNEKFLERAAPEVVERERALSAELEREIAAVRGNLDALDG
ncbi:MAG: valine--tRNA ligase [Planctomycetota bacterium]